MMRYGKLYISGGTIGYTEGDMQSDAMAITGANMPWAQAVITAERHGKGKATRAEYKNSRSGWLHDVASPEGQTDGDDCDKA